MLSEIIVSAVTLLSVYDGDTLTVEAEVWPDVRVTSSIRVYGVDTPEIRGDCDKEKAAAVEARNEAMTFLQSGDITLVIVDVGKYGRPIAHVMVNGESLSNHLIRMELGREYGGGTRTSWC